MTELFLESILSSDVAFMDETTLQVNKEPDRKASSKSYMWIMVSGENSPPTILFHYNKSRAAKTAKEMLHSYKGYVMTDGYSGYNFVGETGSEAIHLACWAHARRKFFEALQLIDEKAKADSYPQKAIEHIRKLYEVEKEIREYKQSSECADYNAIRSIRIKKALPELSKFKNELDEWKKNVPEKGKTGKAISYTLNLWDKLTKYVYDGKCPIDNNTAENAIRPFVVGRKAWLFCDTQDGATATALFYSIISTAKANKLEPYWYMCYLLSNVKEKTSKEDLRALMPQKVGQETIIKFKQETLKGIQIF